MPSLIAKLAPELLSNILSVIRKTTTRSEFSCYLRVCKQWRDVGEPIAWATIVLTNNSLEPFVTAIKTSDRVLSLIKVLTLRLNTIWPTHEEYQNRQRDPASWPGGANPRNAAQWTSLDTLASIIKRNMAGLLTFSLRIDKYPLGGRTGEHHNSPEGAWIRSATLARLLEALPTSCTAVELDTKGREDDYVCGFYEDASSTHLCPRIRRSLPRLHHLRLRLRKVCPGILGKANDYGGGGWFQAPELRTFTVNVNLAPDSAGVGGCPGWNVTDLAEHQNNKGLTIASNGTPAGPALGESGSNEDLQGDVEEEESEDEDDTALLVRQGLTTALRESFRAGMFPKISVIQLLDLESSTVLQYDHFHLASISADETYMLPCRLVDIDDKNLDLRTFVARNILDEEKIGVLPELEDWVEGRTWATSIEGDRFPRINRDLQGSINLLVEDEKLESRDVFRNREGETLPSWALNAFSDIEHCHSKNIATS